MDATKERLSVKLEAENESQLNKLSGRSSPRKPFIKVNVSNFYLKVKKPK